MAVLAVLERTLAMGGRGPIVGIFAKFKTGGVLAFILPECFNSFHVLYSTLPGRVGFNYCRSNESCAV